MLSRSLLRASGPSNFMHTSMRLPLSGTAVVRPIKALPLVRKRLCSTANDVTKTALREENHTFIDKAKLLLPQAGVIAGGIVVAYGISKMVMFVTGTMMSITFTQVGVVGFGAGVLSATLCGALAFGAHRFVTIRPEPIFKGAVSRVLKHQQVIARLGKPVGAGTLRAYTIRQGHFGLSMKRKRLKWRDPRVQMLFQVQGSAHQGMVSVEAIKSRGRVKYTLVTVDVFDDKKDFILVEGNEQRLKVRGQLRGFLQTERVKYLEQNAVDVFDDGHID